MVRALSRKTATCAAAAAAVTAVLAGNPAYAAGPAAPGSQPAHHLRPAGVLLARPAIQSTAGFQIQNGEFQGKCIGIAGAPPNGPAGDWTCTTNPDQTWNWGNPAPNDPNFAQLVNGRGQCLGVAGDSDNAGAQIVGWTCLPGHLDQYWLATGLPDGNDLLLNDNGVLNPTTHASLIGVGGASPANGAPLVLWPNTGHADQEWFPS